MDTEFIISKQHLDDIADAINEKTGNTELLTPSTMATKIATISNGGEKAGEIASGTVTSITARDLSGATLIKEYFFRNCTNLESIQIPAGVVTIDGNAFQGCTNLKTVVIPETVTSIGNYAFQNCSSLESIVIPGSVTSIGNYAFLNCSGLKTITFEDGNGLTLNTSVFSSCSSLETINWPQTSVSMKDPFRFCSALSTVIIPSNVSFTNTMYAFYNCTSLENVEIGSPHIPRNTFQGCTSLSKVWIRSSVDTIQLSLESNAIGNTGPFYNSSSSAILYCEPASKPSGWNTGFNLYSGTVGNVTLTTIYNQSTSPF